MEGTKVIKRFRVLGMLVAIACHDTATAPLELDPVLSARALWSGGELLITDAAFAGQTVRVVLDNDTLPTQSLNDTTVAVRLPRRVGTFPVRVIAGSSTAAAGDVTLHGFQSAMLGPFMSGQPYWLPGSGAPLVFAGADPGAAVVDLHTATQVLTFPESLYSPDCIWTPSPSYRSDRFVLMGQKTGGGCRAPKLWTLSSPPQLIDSMPLSFSLSWYTSGYPSDRRWIFNWNNNNQFYQCDSECVPTSFQSADGPYGVRISPDRDRFLWRPADAAVVYDAQTFDTAFVWPQFHGVDAAFSPDGDTIVAAAHDASATPRLHFVQARASDGAILNDLSIDSLLPSPHFPLGDVVENDPVNPWFYALIWRLTDSVYRPTLVVLDRRTWSGIGVLEVTEDVPLRVFSTANAIVPSPLEHLVYVVGASSHYNVRGSHGVIMRFSTP